MRVSKGYTGILDGCGKPTINMGWMISSIRRSCWLVHRNQWPCQEPKLKVPPQNMASYGRVAPVQVPEMAIENQWVHELTPVTTGLILLVTYPLVI